MVTTPNYDLDVDTTLGGNNASDYIIPSQKAIKAYVDNNTGSTVDQTFDPTSQAAQSGVAIAGAGFLKNITSSNVTTALGYTPANIDYLGVLSERYGFGGRSGQDFSYFNSGTEKVIFEAATKTINDSVISSNIARTSQIPSITIDQTYDGTSTNAQSGVAIEGELSTNYVKAEVQDESGSQSVIQNMGTGINCIISSNYGNILSGLYLDSSFADISYEDFANNELNSIRVSDSGVSIYCDGSFEFGDSNGSVTLSTSNNNLAVNDSEVVTGDNTRFDGQWVLGLNYTLSSATAIGTYTCDLTSYLPSGNDKYEVLLDCQIIATNNTYVSIKDGTYDNYAFCATGGSRPARNIIVIALTGKSFKYDIAGAALSSGYLRLRGYRRIGTNT